MGPFSLVGVAISFPRRMVVDKVNYCAGSGLTVLLCVGKNILPVLDHVGVEENYREVQRLGRAGIRRFRPRRGHQNSPFRG